MAYVRPKEALIMKNSWEYFFFSSLLPQVYVHTSSPAHHTIINVHTNFISPKISGRALPLMSSRSQKITRIMTASAFASPHGAI